MTEQLSSQIHLILPAGTQVVTRAEVKGADGQILARRGAVGETVKPLLYVYRVLLTGIHLIGVNHWLPVCCGYDNVGASVA